jgi:hypothetical protein
MNLSVENESRKLKNTVEINLPASNGVFGASGAFPRVDNSERIESFILSRASDVESPACRQAPDRYMPYGDRACKTETDKE